MAAAAAAAAAKSLQSCPTLCDPTDGSPPGPAIPGILQASTLEWVAISLSKAWKWKVTVKSLCHVQLLATPWTAAYQAPPSMGLSRQEYWSGVPSSTPLFYADWNLGNINFGRENLIVSFTLKELSVQFSSVQSLSSAQHFVTPWISSPGLPVDHQLPEFTQTHVHWVGDTIQPSHPLSAPSPLAPNPSQHQSLFKWVNSSHEVAKVLAFQLQHQSFQWTPRTDLL